MLTLALLILAGLISLALGREVARYVAVRQELERLTSEITNAESSTQQLEHVLASLKSTTFQEGAARTRLNLQKPGEKVLVIPNVSSTNQSIREAEPTDGSPATESNTRRWWKFIFTAPQSS